ncbi:hypothetical protein SLS58_007980 [Diplodia intermedia]|uniref:Cell wall protein n=1 Tax=Diplodia intermedia TaxID=856260 RepID=A0ABR3TIL8_9PEZI
MKTTAILAPAALLAAVTASPVPASSTTFKLIATAPGSPIHAHYLTASDGRFYVGRATNSTCGNIAPVFDESADAAAGALAMYGDGKESAQQQAYIDISGAADGALSYVADADADAALTPEQSADGFARDEARGVVTYEGGDWLACPQGEGEGEYVVFAEKAHGKAGEGCTRFEMATKKVRTPKVVCVYL